MGDEIIASQLKLEMGTVTGIRIGQDYDRRWALENRFAYAMPEVVNQQGPELSREGDMFFADTNLIYTRFATKRLRPYASVGLGMTYLDLVDHTGAALREFAPTVPLGAGLQYRHHEWLFLNVDVRDMIVLGQQVDLETMHNLMLTGGLEMRFGASPNVYHPWSARAQSGW
jgi:hypothetical protein